MCSLSCNGAQFLKNAGRKLSGILGPVMAGKIESWNCVGTKYGMESAMSNK
jgi:hypothetical protein